jgi:TM2 domain-containing membrane protein YozV
MGSAIDFAVDPDAPAKSRLTAGLLGIFLGALGVHRFYLGYLSIGVLQILVTLATCGIGGLWGLIEGVLILRGKAITTDAEGRPLQP